MADDSTAVGEVAAPSEPPHGAPSGVALRRAVADDVATIFRVVNLAYEVETGDTGVAFKTTPRFATDAEIVLDRYFIVDHSDGSMAGCIAVFLKADDGGDDGGVASRPRVAKFGPVAVHPDHQGKGLGSRLIWAAEEWAVDQGCGVLEIDLINWRTDLIDFYGKRGFVQVATEPFPEPERLSRPSHCVILQKPLRSAKT